MGWGPQAEGPHRRVWAADKLAADEPVAACRSRSIRSRSSRSAGVALRRIPQVYPRPIRFWTTKRGMAVTRIVRGALLQATWTGDKESMIQKHEGYAHDAAKAGAQVILFQELFYGP